VLICTWVTAGPSAAWSANATWIVPGSSGWSKRTWIHWPSGPVQLPDSHLVRLSPSTAAYGSRPLAHWLGMAPMPDADEDAVTLAMPWYRAALWYRVQPGAR
jgi:hypothetical protein